MSLSAAGDGRVRLTGYLDTEAAAIVNAALEPLCTPRPTGDLTGAGSAGAGSERAERDDRTPGQRRADALVEICRLVLAAGDLPANGGDRPQISVTIDFEALRRELGAGTLDTGDRLSPAQTRPRESVRSFDVQMSR